MGLPSPPPPSPPPPFSFSRTTMSEEEWLASLKKWDTSKLEKKSYSLNELKEMNRDGPFRHCIKIPYEHSETKYYLHASGNCNTLNGREYVALYAEVKITDSIRAQYNLMP